MKSLKPRLLTAVVGIAILLVLLFLAELWNPIIGIAVGIATVFMTGEYLNAINLLKKLSISIPCLLFSLILPIIVNTSFVYLLIFCFVIAVFSLMIFDHKNMTFSDVAFAITGTLLISLGMSALPKICSEEIGIPFYFVAVFTLPWMADAGGFFIGAAFGRHKLCPNISPKKTVEGAIGGIVFCVLSSVVIGMLFHFFFMPEVKFNFVSLILLGIIVAPLSIVGDLSFSLIKRYYKIKDYGTIFPGHGGMLDRFDSIIFTAPVLVILNQFLPFIISV